MEGPDRKYDMEMVVLESKVIDRLKALWLHPREISYNDDGTIKTVTYDKDVWIALLDRAGAL